MVELSRYLITFGSMKGLIYRRTDSSSRVWYFRVFVKDQNRYIRKSLKTTDIREAKTFAEDELINIVSKQKSGQPLISRGFNEACREFRFHEEKCARDGVKGYAKRTIDLHNHYLNQVSRYIEEKFPAGTRTKLSTINGKKDFVEYLDWRTSKSKISRTSIHAELTCLRMVLQHAVKLGFGPSTCIPMWEFELNETPKRERINPETDYSNVLAALKRWVKKAETETEIYNRELLHHFFLVQAQTGLRTGELKQLKWSDIRSIDKNAMDAVLHIRKEITKVKKSRDVIIGPSTGGKVNGTKINYLFRWKENFARHKNPGDYIFSLLTRGDGYSQDALYRGMASLREDLKAVGLHWYDLYHNRHFYASKAILSGVSLSVIANAMGSSVTMIEKHYSHLLSEQSAREIASKRILKDT